MSAQTYSTYVKFKSLSSAGRSGGGARIASLRDVSSAGGNIMGRQQRDDDDDDDNDGEGETLFAGGERRYNPPSRNLKYRFTYISPVGYQYKIPAAGAAPVQ